MGCGTSSVHPQVPLPELPPGIVQLTKDTPQNILDSAIDIMTRSFAGTKKTSPEPALSWAFDTTCSGENPCDPLLEAPSEERIAAFRWLVLFSLETSLRHGGCFALIDSEDETKVHTCSLNFPPNNRNLHNPGFCDVVKTLHKVGLNNSFNSKRMSAVEKAMTKGHKTYAKDPHWYCQIFATSPESQRNGYSKRMLPFLSQLSDKSGVPFYLETTGEKNEQFYGKCGFEVVERYPLIVGSDKLDVNGGMAAMVRPPKEILQ